MNLASPHITVFVRHSEDCKYTDEFNKRCKCKKHFRWMQNGKRYREAAGTRSWAEAERLKIEREDIIAGRVAHVDTAKNIMDAVDLFITDKKVQGLGDAALAKYRTELPRLAVFLAEHRVYTVQAITRSLMTEYAATWIDAYPSSQTRAMVATRTRSFLRYCFEAQWLTRVPALPKVKVDVVPTMPLTTAEFDRLLDALVVLCPRHSNGHVSRLPLRDGTRAKLRALMLLMRWSGLSIRDALSLEKAGLRHDRGRYHVVTARQKTGTDVSVPIPDAVAQELLEVGKAHDRYIFFATEVNFYHMARKWANRFFRQAFIVAGIPCDGHMVSHRLRDTFACGLLEKGVPLEDVSKALGHTSIKTTEKSYAAWVQGRQARLDSIIEATF